MDRVKEIRARHTAASKGRWSTGPETAAGSVWVYVDGAPLLEPTHHLGRWLRKVFRVRQDSQEQWTPKEGVVARDDRFWKQKQADAAFIANAYIDIPWLIDEVEQLRKALVQIKGGGS